MTKHPRAILIFSPRRENGEALARELRLARVDVRLAKSAGEAEQLADAFVPDAVIVDLHICDESELGVIAAVAHANTETPIVALLPYRCLDLATRIGRRGATTSIEKPASAKNILDLLCGRHSDTTSVRDLFRVQQDYAKRTLAECGGNLSETARLLNIDRRTLRKLISTSDPD